VKYPAGFDSIDACKPTRSPKVGCVRLQHVDHLGSYPVAVLDYEDVCRLLEQPVDLVAVLAEIANHEGPKDGWPFEEECGANWLVVNREACGPEV
jgi:hypothetical protein